MTLRILYNCEIQMHHPIPKRRLDIDLICKKERTCHRVDFALLADCRVKIKLREKLKKKISGLCQRAKRKLWNMKSTLIPVVVRVLGRVLKNLEKRLIELEIREKESRPSRSQQCQDQLEFLKVFWRSEETYCHLISNENMPVRDDTKNSQEVKYYCYCYYY